MPRFCKLYKFITAWCMCTSHPAHASNQTDYHECFTNHLTCKLCSNVYYACCWLNWWNWSNWQGCSPCGSCDVCYCYCCSVVCLPGRPPVHRCLLSDALDAGSCSPRPLSFVGYFPHLLAYYTSQHQSIRCFTALYLSISNWNNGGMALYVLDPFYASQHKLPFLHTHSMVLILIKITINWHSSATLTELFSCFFLSCKANARV